MKVAVGLCGNRFRNNYYGVSSALSTGEVYSCVNTPRCALSFAGRFQGCIVSSFVNRCDGYEAPGPYVRYGGRLGFNVVCRGTRRLNYSFVSAKRCTGVTCDRGCNRGILVGSTTRNGSRDCILCGLPGRLLSGILFPLYSFRGGTRVHTVTTRRGLPITSGPSDRSVYFVPSNGCGGFLRRGSSLGDERKGVMAHNNGVLNGRAKLCGCAVNRHGKLKVSGPIPLCILNFGPTGGRLAINRRGRLCVGRFAISSIGFLVFRGLSRPVRIGVGAECSTGTCSNIVSPTRDNITIYFSRPRGSVAPKRSTIFCISSSVILNNNGVSKWGVRLPVWNKYVFCGVFYR